eukprot:m51a1_g4253 putative pyrroline-5-carboxylate reductase (269) ;mRNA; f:211324-212594
MVRVGFVGVGNMGGALVAALVAKGVCRRDEVFASDKVPAALDRAAREWRVCTSPDVSECVRGSDVIFLAVKPQDMRGAWANNKVLISICAGVQLCTLEHLLGGEAKIVRVMPNTPCMVGAMAAGYACNPSVTEEEAALVSKILSSAGVAYRLPESALNAVTGLSGSGPAYVAYLVREFAKAGEAVGLPAEVSYGLALQTFYGTSRLLQQKKMSPDDLIKMVTSPKGTTYAGRQILEYSAVAQVLLDTVKAGTDRSAELGAAAAIRPKL